MPRRGRGRGRARQRAGSEPVLPRGRGRGRGRARASNRQAHQGRDLRRVDDRIDQRIIQFPNQSFSRSHHQLLCQACNRYLDYTRKNSIDRHLGLDGRQNNNSNTGSQHKRNYDRWMRRDQTVDYTNVGDAWIKICMKHGVNASQSAALAREFFALYPIDNSAAIATTPTGTLSLYIFPRLRLCYDVQQIVMSVESSQDRITLNIELLHYLTICRVMNQQ